jgi:fructan beta-fructosidase
MTLPRELRLTEYAGKPLLCCPVVNEIDKIAGNWQKADAAIDTKEAYQLRLTINLDKNSTITLSNNSDEKYVIDILATARTLKVHRNATTGRTNFNGSFSIPSMQAPLNIEGETVTIDMFVDQSSVEILTKDGTMSMTNLVFPQSLYNSLTIIGATYEAQIRTLNRIW